MVRAILRMRWYALADSASRVIAMRSSASAITRLALSARAYHRILKIARTIADLENAADLAPKHVSEAIQYRSLDRRGLG